MGGTKGKKKETELRFLSDNQLSSAEMRFLGLNAETVNPIRESEPNVGVNTLWMPRGTQFCGKQFVTANPSPNPMSHIAQSRERTRKTREKKKAFSHALRTTKKYKKKDQPQFCLSRKRRPHVLPPSLQQTKLNARAGSVASRIRISVSAGNTATDPSALQPACITPTAFTASLVIIILSRPNPRPNPLPLPLPLPS